MSMSPRLENFARLLIAEVRDKAIRSADTYPNARWLAAPNLPSLLDLLIPDVEDITLYHLLNGIDKGVLNLLTATPKGAVVDLEKEGGTELTKHYMSADGWRKRFSKQRFDEDDFLKLGSPSSHASKPVEDFGKSLVELVRDNGISDSDILKGSMEIKWAKSYNQVMEWAVPDIVDDAIFYFLKAVDHTEIRLFYVDGNGVLIDLNKEGGEMFGWYAMDGYSWRIKFSKERLCDGQLGLIQGRG